MSSRFPPVHDSRYAPRARSRSPPRYQEWRPPGPSNPAFSNRHADFGRGLEPPRGPKTFNEPVRGPGPGSASGPSAPLGPRGRGAPSRSEFRELRDAPPLGTDRSFREREFDRRARPPSPRLRSPTRSFRETPLPPRELDLGRGRRDSRDGPLTTGPTYSDPPPFGQSNFGRGGISGRSRGRGRGDFDFRDRGRRGPPDDRNTFRPRDRSPPTRWGSISRSDRDEWRGERRDEDRWPERDDRDRESDRFRREATSSRFDSRPPTPHQQAPLAPPPADRPPHFDSSRDEISLRRPSTTSLSSAAKEPPRRDPPAQPQQSLTTMPQSDLLAGRVESSAARYGSRTSSPPPSAPQVPAFGSLSFKSQTYSGPTSNVWKASPESRASNPPVKAPVAPSTMPKTVPTAPKAQLTAPPPAAPRAPRALENGPPAGPREPSVDRTPSAPKMRNSSAPQPQVPTAPWALRTDERGPGQFASGSIREGRSLSGSFHAPNATNSPNSARNSVPPGKPVDTLPIQNTSSQAQPVSESNSRDMRPPRSDMAPPKLGTPPPQAPSGPRNAHSFSTSPVLPSPNVPTAPKAIRDASVAPRAATDRGPPQHWPLDRSGVPPSRAPLGAPRAPAWNQWIRPGAPSYREPVVPAKRDASGEEKPQAGTHTSPMQHMSRQISDPSAVKDEELRDNRALKTAPTSPDHEILDAKQSANDERAETHKDSSVYDRSDPVHSDSFADAIITAAESSEEISDEEGMDLDEEDFAQSKAKFERQKAQLEARMVDLSARQYRATTPLEQIANLARITALDLPTTRPLLPPNTKEPANLEESEVSRPIVSPDVSPAPKVQDDLDTDVLTPKQEEVEETEQAQEVPTAELEAADIPIEPEGMPETTDADDAEDMDMEGSDALDTILPEVKPSIEAVSLPYLIKAPLTPLSEIGAFQETLARQNAAKPALVSHFLNQIEESESTGKDLRDEFLERYRDWRSKTQLIDHERADKVSEERQMSAELGLDFDSSSVVAENNAAESRSRLHKFSSEYDIQKVLKESEETARLEQERLERESKRAQIDMEKEAVIPDVWDKASREKNIFKNTNRYRTPVHLTDIYGYEPAVDTFSGEEHKRFLELFKERPKKWGEIASQLPGRTYADCIHHYYEFKWDGRFKENNRRRKGKSTRGRGGKGGPSRSKGAPLMADPSRAEEDVTTGPMLTETGRPRRAATRTAYGDRDNEAKGVSSATSLAKKGLPTGVASSEKPAKRRKTTVTGEKAAKRSRQSLVSTLNTSPHDKEVVISKEELARAQSLEDATLLTGLQAGHRSVQNISGLEYTHENFSGNQGAIESTERPRGAGQTPLQRSSASSYWSVPEQTDFVKFVAHFGTDWRAIANHMGTKTQTMVKNYYARLIQSGNHSGLADAASRANTRIDRKEDIGVPPTPTPINKRRYDNPDPALPRSYGSQGEVMDIDPVPPPQSLGPQQAPAQFQHQSRFSVATQPSSAPPQRVTSTPVPASASPALSKPSLPAQARSNPPSGPKMGFFSESRLERRQTMQQAPEHSVPQSSSPHMQQQNQTPPAIMHQGLSHLTSEFVRNLKEEQDRALSIQKRASQEHVPQVAHHSMYQPVPGQGPVASGPSQPSVLERAIEREERPGTPVLSAIANPRSGSGIFRNILGSPSPLASPQIALHPPFRSAQVPSPPKREEFRPSSVPAPSPAQSVVKPAMAPAPPPEPRKTSNLASLLNSEPEEPRPKKRLSEQGMLQSPTLQVLSTAPTGPSASVFPPRREVFSQTPVPRSEFDPRSAYPQPTSHAPNPSVQHEHMSGRSATPVGSRPPEWSSRPTMAQSLTSSSPHPPTPLERDVRPYFSHRASNLAALNSQSRHNPSPPPNAHPFLQHGRTASLSSRPLTPTQAQSQMPAGMQHMTQGQSSQVQPAQILHPNPYGQPPLPAPHIQQMQAHQQNQLHHRHNSSASSSHSGLHQRQVSRGEDMLRQQEREYHMSRERDHRIELERHQRERAHFQVQQEQQRYAQHRASQPQQFQTHPLPGPSMGLSLREQARMEADQSYREEQYRRERERYEHEMKERGRYGHEANERELHLRRMQQDEDDRIDRMRFDYRNGMVGRSSQGGFGGYPPPPPPQR